VDVGVPGSEHGNVQTGGRGDRVSTISLPGCSTSVALATGPTDEEEEEVRLVGFIVRINHDARSPEHNIRRSILLCITPMLPGKYIPAVSYTIHTRNPGAKQQINLKGKNEITNIIANLLQREAMDLHFFLTYLMHYLPVDFRILKQKCGLSSMQSCRMKTLTL